MITKSGLRFKGTIKPSLDYVIYTFKILTKNYANAYLINVNVGGFYRLTKSLIFLKSPNTILKYAPIPSIRRYVRDNAKVLLHMEWHLMPINDQLWSKLLNLNKRRANGSGL